MPFVLGTCVYHIAHQSAMQSLRQAGQNQEMLQFTQGVYEARELALVRMQSEAAQAQASGIVGVTVGVHNHVWGAHATEFLATGHRGAPVVRRAPDARYLAWPTSSAWTASEAAGTASRLDREPPGQLTARTANRPPDPARVPEPVPAAARPPSS